MSRTTTGWLWVGGQAVLLGALILLPGSDDWPTPPWVLAVASISFFGGLIIIGIAAIGLGTALTPTPVPKGKATLRTSGLYHFVRHPIYSGVLAVVAGMTLRSASWAHAAVAAVTLVFFDRKAAWEEKQLAARFDGYDEYAERTAKFVPLSALRRQASRATSSWRAR